MNILILSAGTRNLLVSYFRKSGFDKVVAVDASPLAPALYVATNYYIVPRMTDPDYLKKIKEICVDERINAILPLQEDELYLFAQQRHWFEEHGITLVVSDAHSIEICRDKYAFYQYLKQSGVPVLNTYLGLDEFELAVREKEVTFPVFVKPRYGCGSIGCHVANSIEFIYALKENYNEELIIQQYNKGKEYGVDVYCDLISGEITHTFIKEKLRMRAGETEKSISTKNNRIFNLVEKTVGFFSFRGPIDIDIFEMDSKFYISEINPRFGGGYPHAFLCGIDFPKNIYNNTLGVPNKAAIRDYPEGIIALKTQSIISM